MEVEQLEKIKIELIEKIEFFKGDHSLANGSTGISLFLYEYGKYVNDSNTIEIALDLFLEQLYDISSIENRDLSLFGGNTGVYWLYQYYLNEDVLESGDSFLNEFDDLLVHQIKLWSKQGNYELLFGISGIAVYFIERYRYNKNEKYLIDVFYYLKKSLKTKNGYNYWSDPEDPTLINLGTAHGIIGCLNLFFEIHKIVSSNDLKSEIMNSINGVLNLIEMIYNNSVKKGSVFPCQLKNNYFESYPSRLGWCYGDLMIGYTLIKHSTQHANSNLTKIGYAIIEHTLDRDLSSHTSALKDKTICHGTSGVSLVLKLLSNYCDNKQLKGKIFSKVNQLNKLSQKLDVELSGPYTYYLNNNQEEYKLNMGLLEGIAGHGLAEITNQSNGWSKILLL